MVPSANTMINDVKGRLNTFILTDYMNQFIDTICNDIYSAWNSCHNSVTLNGINLTMESNPIGVNGNDSFNNMNLYITRIYNVPNINYFNTLLSDFDLYISSSFNTFYQSLKLISLTFEFFSGGHYEGVYINCKNKTGSLQSTSVLNKSGFNSMESDVKGYLSSNGFNLGETSYINILINAITGMINNQLNIYCNSTNWTYGTAICPSGIIANGGKLT